MASKKQDIYEQMMAAFLEADISMDVTFLETTEPRKRPKMTSFEKGLNIERVMIENPIQAMIPKMPTALKNGKN